jgi:dihydroxyacetone kinase-like protein
MRSLVNKPGSTITRSLEGMARSHPDLIRLHYAPDFVERVAPIAPGKVAVISGSGSGHEPLPTGFVGQGMLDAACPGPLFTSPTPMQLMTAAQTVERGSGVVLIVKNYSGGVLNAELTVEMIRAEGIPAGSVVVNDDVAISKVDNRRGLGAAVLAMKVAGAAAEAGYSLPQVVEVAQRAVDNARSMGIATNAHTMPTTTHASPLTEDNVEIGVGIHGEPGEICQIHNGVNEIVERLINPIVADSPITPGDDVLVILSSMGGMPHLELYLFFQEIVTHLDQMGISAVRQLVGTYLTSLGRGGCILTLARMDEELLRLWDAPVHTPALHW